MEDNQMLYDEILTEKQDYTDKLDIEDMLKIIEEQKKKIEELENAIL